MENQDSVCYINKISAIEPIIGADKIELCSVNGWKSIIPKDSVRVGDIVLCIVTDAVIPEAFGSKHGILNYLRRGNRVRTIKLKGVYSDCIVISLNNLKIELEDFYTPGIGWDILEDGQDMMKVLEIFKYEEPEKVVTLPGGKRVKQKDNPNFNKYYKFPNIKNVPNIFNEEDEIIATRKIHGSNARYGIVKKAKLSILDRIKKFFGNEWVEYEYVYGSHNVIKGSDTNGFYSTDIWKTVADRLELKSTLWELAKTMGKGMLGKGIIFYGEVYGPGIQGEKYSYNLKEITVAFFDIELNGEYVSRDVFEAITAFDVNLSIIPVLYRGVYSKLIIEGLVNNQFIENTKNPHEGVVVSHISGERQKIAKFINPDYLIFAEKHIVPDGH